MKYDRLGHGLLATISTGVFVWVSACSSSSSPTPAPSVDAGTNNGTNPALLKDSGIAPGTAGDAAATATGTGTGTGAPPPPPPWTSFVGAGGEFGQTFDNVNWSARSVAGADLFSVTCADRNNGWVSGANGFVSRTTDAGATWTTLTTPFAVNLRTIRFTTTTFGVVAGDGGALAVTNDGGAHWTQANVTTTTLRAAAIADDANVIIVAGDAGTLLRSDDSGAHFTTVAVPGAGDFRGAATDGGAHFVVLVDTNGTVFTSADGAKTFTPSGSAPVALDSVSVSDDGSRAIAVGAKGTALFSRGGAFTPLTTGTTEDLHAALVTEDDARFYLAGENGTVLTSVDQGAHFTPVAVTTKAAIYSLDDL